jgi:hypothetical protein
VSRDERTTTTTWVRYVAEPLASKGRENGPHLGDLRRFVEECEGLPDSIKVHINKGHMGESGRYDVTFETSWQRPPNGAEPTP